MTATATPHFHPTTGLPVRPSPAFKVGDIVTETIGGDSYPAVVVHATPKTTYVRRVYSISTPTPVGTGHESAEVVADPDSVAIQLAAGREGSTKYVLRISKNATTGSINDAKRYGSDRTHASGWVTPGSDFRGFRLYRGGFTSRNPHV